MMIDANVYWFPEEIFHNQNMLNKFMNLIPRAYDTVGILSENEGKKEITIERPVGFPGVNYREGEYELEKILHDMDCAGIDKAVLKIPCCHEWFDVEMARYFNDGMYEFAKKSNGRLIPLAIVTPFGGEDAIKELNRCIKDLGMKAAQMSAHYGNLYLDNEAFSSVFEVLEEYQMSVYVHHTPVPVETKMLLDYNNLRRSYGRCIDQMTAVCREMMSNMFEEYPHIKVVHSMLGGGFFAYKNMLIPKQVKTEDTVKRFDNNGDKMLRYYEKNIFFEMSHAQPWGKEQLESAVKILGSDHIIYGSSYPVRMEWMSGGPEFVNLLEISEEDKVNILSKTAERIYSIEEKEG